MEIYKITIKYLLQKMSYGYRIIILKYTIINVGNGDKKDLK